MEVFQIVAVLQKMEAHTEPPLKGNAAMPCLNYENTVFLAAETVTETIILSAPSYVKFLEPEMQKIWWKHTC